MLEYVRFAPTLACTTSFGSNLDVTVKASATNKCSQHATSNAVSIDAGVLRILCVHCKRYMVELRESGRNRPDGLKIAIVEAERVIGTDRLFARARR